MSARAVMVAWGMVLGLVLLSPGVAEAGRGRTQYSGVVNLNEASEKELDQLPGVGLKAAESILAHRQKRPFQRIEELVKVKGFGKKKVEKLKPYLTLTGPTTLKAEKPDNASDKPKKKRKSRH
ncbi:ComEA family DNA-binding protein [Hyalangium rubrum]|uniref:Helix-hairpin-helix domain-containing protein n=1 Tax=Hyalangium rubrum TaxID=3103134 RepID=A0ABU5H278_9BACT|nr:helix-hairpin-helix domain-containing protein [Hyalangium sp. s54d21]MDY7227567.1 helix-hairpin-helix domain-containing protein [Hyalangium sp. s54d21]